MDEKIGQMIMVGFRGEEADPSSPIVKDIEKNRIGGVVLFDRDVALGNDRRNIRSPEQVRRLIASLQEHTATPLWVAVDQEGGRVRRLKEERGFPPQPSAEEIGRMDDPKVTERYAMETAAALADVGFNVNLAPVVDLNSDAENPVIGRLGRSFSANEDTVVRHARIVIDCHGQHGVATVLKHFPGHGSSRSDSHLELPDITESWRQVELEPFRQLIAEDRIDMVMSGHLFHRGLDRDFPATLSRAVITGILREELGFSGVVISDDMDMKAIADHFGLERAVELAVNAGIDILAFGNNLHYDEKIAIRIGKIMRHLIREGKIPLRRIEESCSRIFSLKQRMIR